MNLLKTRYNDSTLRPDIRIEPYCVFCRRFTRSVQEYMHVYPERLPGGFERVWIRFPAHRFCYIWRKAAAWLGGLTTAVIVFLLTGWLARVLFAPGRELLQQSLCILLPLGFISLLGGWIAGIRCRSRMANTIHDYYVLKENLPEIRKTWRRGPRRQVS